VITHRLTC